MAEKSMPVRNIEPANHHQQQQQQSRTSLDASAATTASNDTNASAASSSQGADSGPVIAPVKTVPQRNRPGTKYEDMYQWPLESLDKIESAFALREYLQALIRKDPHDVDRLIELPPGQDDYAWLYEHLCQVCLELNYLIVKLEPECTPEVCPEMRAEAWMYYCATHPQPRECCAIDYLTHALDGASALLNSVKHFPSRICIPQDSDKNFQSIARRLYRIFGHAYFHHRDIFDTFEADTSLYARFLKLSRTRQLLTEMLIIIPDPGPTDQDIHVRSAT
ncbi:MOB member 4, phocein [Actinomortierella ambigua]|uniref:MOB member 4, phocein n=1 Tax=Actinomortierella ambigua TaxID=1343610 RepID=A0A9P6QFQ9_9FUNG|nr:MOB member 4, phocein [Actinomortierella ambigua]